MTHLPPHSKEKGFTPEDDQGRPKWWLEAQRYGDRDMNGNRMSEIPEDIRKAAENLVKTWISAPHQDDADLAQIVGRAILAERERCARLADDFPRARLLEAKYDHDVAHDIMELMLDLAGAIRGTFTPHHYPSLPSSLPEREQA